MLGVAEVVGKVEDEDTALKAVLPVVLVQMSLQAVKRKVDPFVLGARAVVIDESRLKYWRDHAITEVSLDRALADMNTADMSPFAAVIEVELIEAAAFIQALYQGLSRFRGVRDDHAVVALGRMLPAHRLAADEARLEQVSIRENVCEVAAGSTPGVAPRLSLCFAALVSRLASFFACHKKDWSPPYSIIVGRVF